MGYKLAGFDVVGCNEIDPKVFDIYKRNHRPKHGFVCSIRDMIDRDLPDELFDLDILDGSPPCTSFSTAGNRDKDWGKIKKFSEGQAFQRLDDLFFEFIALAAKLKPKIVIAENVTGMIKGKAKGYVKEIARAFDVAGYDVQLFNLNAATMGVPQARQRVFFLARRKDLNLPKIKINFNEKPISFGEACDQLDPCPHDKTRLTPWAYKLWSNVKQGQQLAKAHPDGAMWNHVRIASRKPCPTLAAAAGVTYHPTKPRLLNVNEWTACSSFPVDMDWGSWSTTKAKWAMGMSVPPFMVQRIALEVKKQWLDR